MEDESNNKPAKRPPKKVTATRLHNQALYYLDQFPTTAGKMRNVLINKSKKAAEFHEQDWDAVLKMIDGEIERLIAAGILNDKLYAESKARVLSRRGKSVRMIKASLNDIQVDEENIENAVSELGGSERQTDLQSAKNYIKRRKFGPYRASDKRHERREKDMAALARVGFGYDIVKMVIDAETIEELEAMTLVEF